MRAYLLYIFCVFGLTGCVNYAGMKSRSVPLNTAALTTPHVYPLAAKNNTHFNWWARFHDPQLNQLMQVALSDSPTLQIAASRLIGAEQLAQGAKANLWPSIDASGYLQRERFSYFGLVPPPFNGKTFNIGEVGLNFNYDLDFWGKYRQTLAAKVSEACAAQADLAEARLLISTRVASVYFQLQYNLAERRIAEAIVQQRKAVKAIISTRSKRSIVSDIPLKAADADVQSAIITVNRFKQAEMLSRHQLAVLLGKNPLQTQIVTPSFAYQHVKLTLPSRLPAHLLAARPDIAAARERAKAAAHEINVAKAFFFPDINLTALFSYQTVGLGHFFDVKSQNNLIGGAVDLPIFDAGARRANLGVKYAEYDVAVNQYNQTILTALREVADQLSILTALNADLRAQREGLAATTRNYRLTSSRYSHGIVDYMQVLSIKQNVLQQQATQVDLQARQLLATVAMIKALGGNDLTAQEKI